MPYEYRLLRVLGISMGALVFLYLYFVSASVLNVIAQKEADRASATLESNIGSLEGTYFALAENITASHARTLGLEPLTQASYVYRMDSVGIAASSHNAI